MKRNTKKNAKYIANCRMEIATLSLEYLDSEDAEEKAAIKEEIERMQEKLAYNLKAAA